MITMDFNPKCTDALPEVAGHGAELVIPCSVKAFEEAAIIISLAQMGCEDKNRPGLPGGHQ